ncbi:MAG TPA: hypothetical protein VHY21_18085 [Pseudonocardiaceae bacterium]|nr:hypothetical protein [Pseudonocardiaceae bacterium]
MFFGIAVLGNEVPRTEAALQELNFYLICYVVVRLVQFIESEARSGWRKWLVIGGVLALLILVWVLSRGRWVAIVWVIACVADVATVFSRGSQPTRRLEIVSGVLGSFAGVLATVFTFSGEIRMAIIPLGIWLLVLGVIVLIIVFVQHNVARGLANIQPLSGVCVRRLRGDGW